MRTPIGAQETSKYNLLLFALLRKIRYVYPHASFIMHSFVRYLLIAACKNPPDKQKQMLQKKSASSSWKLGYSYEMGELKLPLQCVY